MTVKKIYIFGIVSLFLFSCKNNKLDIDSSNVKVSINYENFDSLIKKSDSKNLIQNHHRLQKEMTEIYEYQIGYCLGIGRVSDTAFVNSIQQFKNDPFIKRVENRIDEKFINISLHKENITQGFKNLKFHFPNGKTPTSIAFLNSLFRSNAWSTSKEIGIGLERYLGTNTDVIKELPAESFFEWVKEGMNIEYLERDALCSWIMTHYVPENETNLAEGIIRWGKIIYLTEAAFPNVEKNIIIRYSPEDLKWAEENEFAFWKYLVDEKLLFKNNERDKSNMLNDGPFTIGLPEKGPDRLGQFLGWRMIQIYMEKNDISLEALVKVPYNEILQAYEIKE